MINKISPNTSICFPHPPGAGGPGSFQLRFEEQLKNDRFVICYANDKKIPNVVVVVGGTIKLFWLLKMKLNKVPIIYRLDGISWLHKKKKVSLKDYIRAELSNFSKKIIHSFIADIIVYQSEFVKNWWYRESWVKRENYVIIYNGIKKKTFSPNFQKGIKRLVILEGIIDYTPYAIRLLNDISLKLNDNIVIDVYGKFKQKTALNKLNTRIRYNGFIPLESVQDILYNSVYLSLDINPACPNTVIEALSASAPVVAFDTGAIRELIDDTCGKVVSYGSNPWNLQYPDVYSLIKAINSVFESYNKYSIGALKQFELKFEFNNMYSKYTNLLEKTNLENLN